MSITEDQLISLVRTSLVGLGGLIFVLWLNSFVIRRVSLRYEVRGRGLLARHRYNRVFLAFFLSVLYLALTQLASISLWAVLLGLLGIVADPISGLLFAGSCYTTVGILSDIAPPHWKLLPIFIAVSGIFSFALTTTTVLNMAPLFRRAWFAKHAQHVRAVLRGEGIALADLHISDQIREALLEAGVRLDEPGDVGPGDARPGNARPGIPHPGDGKRG